MAQQVIGATGARIQRRAWHCKHLPPLLHGKARGDQRAGSFRRLDHHHPAAQAGNDPVASWEIAASRLPAIGHFADQQAVAAQLLIKGCMFRGIDLIDAACHNRDGAARQSRHVRPPVNAPRQTRYNHKTRPAQILCQPFRHFQSGSRCIARADNRNRPFTQQRDLPAHGQQRRRGVNLSQQRRVKRLPQSDQFRPVPLDTGHLLFGLLMCTQNQRAFALACKGGQSRKRCGGTAKAIDQCLEQPRPDPLGADQSQPITLLVFAQ